MAKKKRFSQKSRPPAQSGAPQYPMATVAFYGPDETKATKVVVGIITKPGAAPAFLERWHSDHMDVRHDRHIAQAIAAFIGNHHVINVATVDRLIGCPHEEGKDYPEGRPCPYCPYWEGRDRWTGFMVN